MCKIKSVCKMFKYRMPQRELMMPQGGIACAAHCEVELIKDRSIQFVKSSARWQSELSSWVLCRIEISCVWKVIRNCELKLNWPPQKHTILWLWCPVRKIIEYQWLSNCVPSSSKQWSVNREVNLSLWWCVARETSIGEDKSLQYSSQIFFLLRHSMTLKLWP